MLHGSGHVLLTDFDLSYGKGVTTPRIEKILKKVPKKVGPPRVIQYISHLQPIIPVLLTLLIMFELCAASHWH